jgi:ADP-heptose:LPS heptosyltransferase
MNFLITRHDKIGDFITSLPLFYVIKKANPNAKIYALVSDVNMDLAKEIEFIDEVILYDKNHFWNTVRRVRRANISISISAFIDTKLGWLLFLSGIKDRISPATKVAQIFFNNTIKQKRSRVEKTEVEYNLDLAKHFNSNINTAYPVPLLKLHNFQNFRAVNQLKHKRLILLHPGYGGSSNGNITFNEYMELAGVARLQKNIQIVWTFGPDDLDAKNHFTKIAPKRDIIFQPETLLDFCYLINDSELLISTSTGPMHLAGLLNIKTISFFGDDLFSSPKRWATVSDPNKQHNFIAINADFNKIKNILRII